MNTTPKLLPTLLQHFSPLIIDWYVSIIMNLRWHGGFLPSINECMNINDLCFMRKELNEYSNYSLNFFADLIHIKYKDLKKISNDFFTRYFRFFFVETMFPYTLAHNFL